MEKDTFYKLLDNILIIRVTEQKIAEDFEKNDIISFLHLCIGEEATAVGVSLALNKFDQVFGNHRSHGHYLAKGGNYEKMIYEIYGDENGCCKGFGGSMHMLDRTVGFVGSSPILGSAAPIVCGIASAKKFNKESGIAVGYLGDGNTEEGSFYESVNLAGLLELPVLYVIEDNKYSVQTNHSSRKVKGYDYKSIFGEGLNAIYKRVNGQDVEEVYEATRELKSRIITENRVGILHADVLRFYKHSGSKLDPEYVLYKTENDYEYILENDPINIIKEKLNKIGEEEYKVVEHIKSKSIEIENLFESVRKNINVR